LSRAWADSLQAQHILARAAIQIVTTDLENNTLYPRERSLHSVICSEKQLSPMTLSRAWADSLQAQHILARAAIQIVTTDLENNTLY
ncbi:hypothetical protein E7X19_26620, partial [Bacteroides fragilis]